MSPEFIQEQLEEFNIGKRHLANMMNEDPESFTQEDIDVRKPVCFYSGTICGKEQVCCPLMRRSRQLKHVIITGFSSIYYLEFLLVCLYLEV